jgi:hypothetical protein
MRIVSKRWDTGTGPEPGVESAIIANKSFCSSDKDLKDKDTAAIFDRVPIKDFYIPGV